MNKKQLIIILTCPLLILCYSNVYAQLVEQDKNKHLVEANTNFTYQGKPIHPGLVQEFSSWISDKGYPITVSVDISAAYDSNEYSEDEVKIADNGNIIIYGEDNSYFCYRWLGRLDNGLHVLYVVEGGGVGSGVFKDLKFVRFDIGEGIDTDNQRYERLLMTIVRTYTLGDRDNGTIEFLNDKVVVGKSKYRDEPVTLEFDKEGIK